MRRAQSFRAAGVVLVGLVALAIGTRPALKAQQQPTATAATAFVGGAFGGQEATPKVPPAYLAAPPMTLLQTRIRLKLQEKTAMNFPDETPLAEVVKYIRESTIEKDQFPEGIPIYLDPFGLQQADKTPKTNVTIDLKGIPLATTLQLALKQLDLTYWIHPDGLLIITNKDADDIPVAHEVAIMNQLSAIQREIADLRAELQMSRGGGMGSGPVNTPPAGGARNTGGMMGMNGGFR